MPRREGPSVALGAAALVALAALFVAGRLIWNRLPSRTPAAEACCKSPIEIIDRDGARLGCVTDVTCAAMAGDRVNLSNGCEVEPQGMSANMRVLAGLKINVNTASAADLTQIDGVTSALAERIIATRSERGRIDAIETLDSIQGVGPATMASLQKHLSTSE